MNGPGPLAHAGDAAADAPLPDGVTPLAAHVRGPAELARVLAQIGVVTDEVEAARLQPALAAGQVLVTRKGAVFRWDGHVAGADAPSAAALRLGQKNRLKELEAEIDEARARVETGERALAEAGARVRREDERLRACRDEMRLLQRRLTDAREALAAAERAAGDLMRRHAVAAEALSRTETQAEELAAEAEGRRRRACRRARSLRPRHAASRAHRRGCHRPCGGRRGARRL